MRDFCMYNKNLIKLDIIYDFKATMYLAVNITIDIRYYQNNKLTQDYTDIQAAASQTSPHLSLQPFHGFESRIGILCCVCSQTVSNCTRFHMVNSVALF